MDINALWYATENSPKDANYIPLEYQSFEKRRDLFLWVLERLLCEGRLKLAKGDHYLRGSIEQQIELFRKAVTGNVKLTH